MAYLLTLSSYVITQSQHTHSAITVTFLANHTSHHHNTHTQHTHTHSCSRDFIYSSLSAANLNLSRSGLGGEMRLHPSYSRFQR